jgi:hypothetical protein
MSPELPDSSPPPKKPPLFGVVSLLFPSPFLIFLLLSVVDPHPPSGSATIAGAAIAILLILLSLCGGLISALIGLARGERYSFLSLIGLLLNAFILIYIMTYDSRHHHV